MRGRLSPSDSEQHNKRPRAQEEDSLRERLRQAIEEQDKAFVRLVEERRSQVRRIEEQSRDIQAQLVEAQRKLREAEAQLSNFRARTLQSQSLQKEQNDSLPFKGKIGPHDGDTVEISCSSFPCVMKGEPDDIRTVASLAEAANGHCLPHEQQVKLCDSSIIAQNSSCHSPSKFKLPPVDVCTSVQVFSQGCNESAFQGQNINFESTEHQSRVPDAQTDRAKSILSTANGSSRSNFSAASMDYSDCGVSQTSFEKTSLDESGQGKHTSGTSCGIGETDNIISDFNTKGSADLVSLISSNLAPSFINISNHFYHPSQHKRKLRGLVMNPTSGQICVTSALDGLFKLWKIENNGYSIFLLDSVDASSPILRKWPENVAWHPSGESLFACYAADGNDCQVSIFKPSSKVKVEFLEERPHEKGIINALTFVPSSGGSAFATGGCDHAVVLWKEEHGHWRPEVLHKSMHSSAVMGIAGLKHKSLLISIGQDKRLIGFDVPYGHIDFRYQLDSKGLGILVNPVDVNLYMVHTGTLGKQIRLFDLRTHQVEVHAFGWRQDSSESLSALINQNWSPDGLYIATGSVDPKIHIFDIRYNGKEPSQTVSAHKKRVLSAAWHHTLPLMVSISSDLNIGLLRISR